MMKRIFALLLCAATLLTSLAFIGCEKEEKEEAENEENDEEEDEDKPLSVGWNRGYIGSLENKDFRFKINTDADQYVYSDVIEMGAAGTKITFTDKYGFADTAEIFSLSSWIKSAGQWVIDENGVNISSSSKLIKSKADGNTVYTYVSTNPGECVRFCFRAGQPGNLLPDIYMYETNEQGTAKDIIEIKEWVKEDMERAYYEILEGKTINVIGDSLLAGQSGQADYVWPALLASKYNMAFKNYAIAGCTLSGCEGGNNPIIERYSSMADNDPDIVIIEGGRNDYNKCAPLGSVYSHDTTTYYGALRTLIEGLREKYPNAEIIAVSFWNASDKKNDDGRTCNEYTNAMKNLCKNMGVPLIDATDEKASGVYMTDPAFRAEYCVAASDVCHLNNDGMKLALPFFEKEIARILSENK